MHEQIEKFYTATKQSTNLVEHIVDWTYIKQLFIETPVNWYSINVPEWKVLFALNLILIKKKEHLYIWVKIYNFLTEYWYQYRKTNNNKPVSPR